MDPILPKKPERPLDSDCCGQGCSPCVLDIYDEDLKIWERECAQIISGQVEGNEAQHDKVLLAALIRFNFTTYNYQTIGNITSQDIEC